MNACKLLFLQGIKNEWQGRQDLNPQPADLESAALPVELLPFVFHKKRKDAFFLKIHTMRGEVIKSETHSTISETTPAPTVRPPSRTAKRTPFSMAISQISSTSKWTLSPGMTISVFSGSVTEPVTSVVRK